MTDRNVTITIEAQEGTTTHGYPNLLCSPASWTDILVFFASNYLSHVATVVTYPGESTLSTIVVSILALLLPTAGLWRGLNSIVRCAQFQKTSLKRAARAGALCMVVRNRYWRPKTGEAIQAFVRGPLEPEVDPQRRKNDFLDVFTTRAWRLIYWLFLKHRITVRTLSPSSVQGPSLEKASSSHVIVSTFQPPWLENPSALWDFDASSYGRVRDDRIINGGHRLPQGYAFAYIPVDAVIEPLDDAESIALSESFSMPKAIASIVQLLFSLVQLAIASNAEINRYRFASFSLTVVPYAIMSLVNLTANLLTPAYAQLHMVSSDVMDEASNRGGLFNGVVGRLINQDLNVAGSSPGCFSATFSVRDAYQGKAPIESFENPAPRSVYPSDAVHLDRDIGPPSPTPVFGSFASQQNKSSGGLTIEARFVHIEASTKRAADVASFALRERDKDFVKKQYLCSGITSNAQQAASVILRQTTLGDCLASTLVAVPACSNFQRRQSPRKSYLALTNAGLIHWHPGHQYVFKEYFSWIYASAAGALYFAINGGLSGFHKGQSTLTQQGIFMAWVACSLAFGGNIGQAYSDVLESFNSGHENNAGEDAQRPWQFYAVWFMVVFVPTMFYGGGVAITGFVIVGTMLKHWGSCIVV